MKKSELKNIIKECVKEVIFEEGILSGIITEVAQGLQSTQTINEVRAPAPRTVTAPTAAKKQVLAAVAKNSYDDVKKKFSNPELFEGTQPIQGGGARGALSGLSSGDSGVDISNIPGFGNWDSVVNNLK